ncbi:MULTISPECIES: TerD family protein [unclassified Psychrobacillus]|uniref:TerD family protein n=1 Tax=unclassified Psychrobacillus TaxID=2636677 RepID=UPI00146EB206|nr:MULTISPECIES: TerD family protein [unclassified Psychrobacillus]MCM3359355.1 TerD family protein [Psychrobacillus sp. MER TA 171]NME06469.1 TerD family protein [Psychrobacillus sp. BL-248-WT-3]
MAINLVKGQKIDLTKGRSSLKSVMVGLGWDPVSQKSGGFLGSLFGGGSSGAAIDCDASVLLLNENGKLSSKQQLIYFGNKTSNNGSVVHMGDNRTGDGDGDDEVINVNLKSVASSVHRLLFVVNIYQAKQRKQDFGLIKNAFIRLVDNDTRQELVHYNLSDNYSGKTSLFLGELYRDGEEWKFSAIGEGTADTDISSIANKYL